MQNVLWQDNLLAFLLGAALIYSSFWLSWQCRRLRKVDSPTVHIIFRESIEPISCTLTILVFLLLFDFGIAMIFLGMAMLMALLCAFVPLAFLATLQSHWRRISWVSALLGAYFQFVFCGCWTLLGLGAKFFLYDSTFRASQPDSVAYGFYYASCTIGFIMLSLWFPWKEHLQVNKRIVMYQKSD